MPKCFKQKKLQQNVDNVETVDGSRKIYKYNLEEACKHTYVNASKVFHNLQKRYPHVLFAFKGKRTVDIVDN